MASKSGVGSRHRCELSMLGAKNLDDAGRRLFVRYYVVIGNGMRFRIDSWEISAACCSRCPIPIASVTCQWRDADRITIELRRRKAASAAVPPLLRKLLFGSRLLGSVSMSWKEVLKPAPEAAERWIVGAGSNPPALLVGLNIHPPTEMEAGSPAAAPKEDPDACRSLKHPPSNGYVPAGDDTRGSAGK